MSPAAPISRVFVYGTLQRGQCRERCWPHRPVRVDEATIRAALYDLGPYPAIGPGDDLIAGELWEIAPEHLQETLDALDEVEGYAQLGNDLYVRRVVTCRLESGRELPVWTYYFGHPERLSPSHRVLPIPRSSGLEPVCAWPIDG